MNEKWKRVENDSVLSVWKCPECGEMYETTFANIAEVGTPVCPDCDIDCEFRHVKVKVK